MIRVSISYGFGEDNRYNADIIPENIQWALFQYENFKEADLEYLERNNINVNVVHLPLDSLRRDPQDIYEMMTKINIKLKTKKFVIHPNKHITSFLYHFIEWSGEYPKFQLCVENFQWRKKKKLRSPLEIIEFCIRYPNHISFCLDTSHTEKVWFDHRIINYILTYTDVIHLSNRNKSERKQHMPFNTGKGDLNLMAFVNNLKFIKWRGDLVLEYMQEYSNKKLKNYRFLKEHLNAKNTN
jgi:sugar phosphate isomerase/epimerase